MMSFIQSEGRKEMCKSNFNIQIHIIVCLLYSNI
jgi:hypothetical protein